MRHHLSLPDPRTVGNGQASPTGQLPDWYALDTGQHISPEHVGSSALRVGVVPLVLLALAFPLPVRYSSPSHLSDRFNTRRSEFAQAPRPRCNERRFVL